MVVVHHDLQTVTEYFDWVTLITVQVVASGPVDDAFTDENLRQDVPQHGTLLKGRCDKESLWSLLSDYTFQVVALGSALMGVISGVMGSFAVLRKQSLLGDGVSHAALPGVVTAFLLTGSKQTEVLLTGALISGLMATLLMVNIVRHSRVKFDGALALVMSVFFGLGLVLLTYVQKQPNANQAGLNRFIFGQASTLLRRDLAIMLAAGGALALLTALFWKEIKLSTFDRDYARSLGFSPRKLDILVSSMTVLAIIVGPSDGGRDPHGAHALSPRRCGAAVDGTS